MTSKRVPTSPGMSDAFRDAETVPRGFVVPGHGSPSDVATVVSPPEEGTDPSYESTDGPAFGAATLADDAVDADLLLQALHRGARGESQVKTDPIPVPSLPPRAPGPAVSVRPSVAPNDAVEDVMRGLREGQERPWAPTPIAATSSDGASYAAHHGVHAIPRRSTPETQDDAKVLINQTLPFGLPSTGRPTPPGVQPAAGVRMTTLPELDPSRHALTIVRAAAAPSRPPSAVVLANRSQEDFREPRIGKPMAALATLVVVLLIGGGVAWRFLRVPAAQTVQTAQTTGAAALEGTATAAFFGSASSNVQNAPPVPTPDPLASAPVVADPPVASAPASTVASARRPGVRPPAASTSRPAAAAARTSTPASTAPPKPTAPSRPIQETFE